MFKLHAWQQAVVELAKQQDSAFIAWEMSLGKTPLSVKIVDEAWGLGSGVNLVVLPLGTRKGWTREITRQLPDANVERIELKNKVGKTALMHAQQGKPGWYLIGWELMRTGALSGLTFDTIIADETHRQANSNSLQAISLELIKSRKKLALSGTPAGNNPSGLFSTCHWLWPEQYKSYIKWVDEYWLTRRNGAVIDFIRERIPGQIVRDMPLFSRELVRDHRDDMPDVLPTRIVEVELTATQRKIYNKLAETSGVWIDDGFMSTGYPLTQDMRLRQIALGVPKVTEDWQITYDLNSKSSKIAALLDILKDEQTLTDTFLVLTHSARFVPVIVAQLRAKKIRAEAYTGETSVDTRELLLDQLGTSYRVLVASIAAISTGVDGLQYKCHNMVWMSKHPNALENTQASARLDRPGQAFPINVWNIVAEDTVDIEAEERLLEIAVNLESVIDNDRYEGIV